MFSPTLPPLLISFSLSACLLPCPLPCSFAVASSFVDVAVRCPPALELTHCTYLEGNPERHPDERMPG